MQFLLACLIALTTFSTSYANSSAEIIRCKRGVQKPQLIKMTISEGTSVEVHAEKIGGSGYRWISSEGLETSSFISSGSGSIGGGGLSVFELPLKLGKNVFRFEYRRAWEASNTASSTCVVTVTVKE